MCRCCTAPVQHLFTIRPNDPNLQLATLVPTEPTEMGRQGYPSERVSEGGAELATLERNFFCIEPISARPIGVALYRSSVVLLYQEALPSDLERVHKRVLIYKLLNRQWGVTLLNNQWEGFCSEDSTRPRGAVSTA